MAIFNPFLRKNKGEKNPKIIEAIKKDDVKKLTSSISKEDINTQDNDFNTPINYTLEFNAIKCAKYLLENGAELEDTLDGDSIISYMIKSKCSVEFLKFMLKQGATAQCEWVNNPLEVAISSVASKDIFNFVLENFWENVEQRNKNLIHTIVESELFSFESKIEIIELLIKKYKMDMNNVEGELHIVIKMFNKRDFQMLSSLVKLGGEVSTIADKLHNFMSQKEIKELSPFILEHSMKYYQFTLQVLDFDEFKKYIESTDDIENKKIFIALAKNKVLHDKEKVLLAKILLQKGVDINELSDDNYPVNALYTFTSHFTIGKNTLFLDFMIDNGADIQSEGFSPLFNAIVDNDIQLTKHLLEKGADVNYLNYFDNTALNCIITPQAKFERDKERIAMMNLLLKYGLDMDLCISHYKNSGSNYTPIMEGVVDVSSSEFIKFMLEKFPDIEINTNTIRYAIQRDIDIKVVSQIIEKNPYVLFERAEHCELRDEYFDSGILEIAVKEGEEELANYILDNFKDIKTYSDIYPLALVAFDYGCSFQTVKKLIQADSDINRLYYVKLSDDLQTETMAMCFVREFSDNVSQEDKVKVLQIMVDNGADLNIPKTKVYPNKQFLDSDGILLIHALYSDSLEKKVVEFFLDNGVNPTIPTANLNESQLHSMINRFRSASDEKCLEYLVLLEQKGYKIDLKHKNTFDTTIFIAACMMNRPKTLKHLATLGADIHIVGGFDNSPALHKAISNYSANDPLLRAQTVRALVELGCDIEQFDSEQFTPLMSASNYGCFEAVRVLLELGANPNIFNEAGQNAAHTAILGESSYDDSENLPLIKSKILAALKDGGANLNQGSEQVVPPLHLSIYNDAKEMFDTLLKLDLDINTPDMTGKTPLMTAIAYSSNMYYTNKLMNKKDIDLGVVDGNNESIHFSAVIRGNETEGAKILEYFLAQDLPIGDGKGFSLLHTAAYYVNIEAFKLIKDRFKDMNIPDTQGFTPLHWASYSNLDIEQSKRVYMIRLLIKNGADINQKLEDGTNTLALAVLAGFTEVSDELIKQGCDVRVALNRIEKVEGMTPEPIAYLESHL